MDIVNGVCVALAATVLLFPIILLLDVTVDGIKYRIGDFRSGVVLIP